MGPLFPERGIKFLSEITQKNLSTYETRKRIFYFKKNEQCREDYQQILA